jgi:selenocysteine lyase/cysteine desulfurase
LAGIDGVTVVTPIAAMAGLVNFTIQGMDCPDVAEGLFARGYTIRSVESLPCTLYARGSIGWWNTEDEVAGLAGAVADLAGTARIGCG